MENIARFFVKNYKFTFMITLGVVVFGVLGLLRIKAESYPAVDFAMATITANLDGASAKEVETRVTKPIEDEIRSVSGLKDVRSTSQPGKSTIVVRADIDHVDVDEVMSDLQRAVDRVSNLPQEMTERPKFLEIKSEEFPVIEIAVVGPNKQRQRDIIVDHLKDEIEDNKSVLSVRLTGFKKRRFNIQLDSVKMDQQHIGIEEIVRKIQQRNRNIPGGKLEKDTQQKLIRVEGEIHNVSELENLVIRSNFSGKVILLKDVATVEDGEETTSVLTRYNGEEATLMIVTKKGGEDTIAMVEDIEQKLNRFREIYEDQYQFIVYNNEANRVRDKLSILSGNALTGLVLVLFFLMLFLPGRIGFVASLSLPLGVLATMGFLPILGMNLNAVTILALVIALGMLVDNSVVVAENYARLRSEGLAKYEAVYQSIAQLWRPITATVLTTVAAFLPMLVTTGIMGEFIKYIPIIVSLALCLSLWESFCLLPMRLVRIDIREIKKNFLERLFDRFAVLFEKMVIKAVQLRYLTAIAFTGLLVLSYFMMVVFNKMILFPNEQTEIYIGRVEMEKGTTLKQTYDTLAQLSKLVHQKAGQYFNHIIARAGTMQTAPIDPKKKDGDYIGSLYLYANDETKNNVNYQRVLEDLRAIRKPSGVKILSFEARVNGPPVGEAINATFRSNNDEHLNTVVNEIMTQLQGLKGVRDVAVDRIVGDDEVYVHINHAKADRLGLDVTSIGNTIRSAISGRVLGSVNLNNKDIDIFIRMNPNDRLDEKDLEKIRLSDRLGNLIPLAQVAHLEVRPGGPQVKHFDYKRSLTLTANINEKLITAMAANAWIVNKFKDLKKKYPEVSLIQGGEAESTKESLASLFDALVISLIGIFALLVLVFNSFFSPIIIMTTIPLGLVGFSVAFAFHSKPISFMALIGVIGLGGIIVNSGIILISFINELREQGQSLVAALGLASRLRLRAVVVSSLTTISGLLPTAYGIGGRDAILMPMTLAMAWGLTSGTILTLIWVPCAYAIGEDITHLVSVLLGKFKPMDHDKQGDPLLHREDHIDSCKDVV